MGIVERIAGTVEGELRGFHELESRSTPDQIVHICTYLVCEERSFRTPREAG